MSSEGMGPFDSKAVQDAWINPRLVLGEDETELEGEDGNAGAIMGRVSRALRRTGNPIEVREAYRREAMSGDYDHLLRVSLAYMGDA